METHTLAHTSARLRMLSLSLALSVLAPMAAAQTAPTPAAPATQSAPSQTTSPNLATVPDTFENVYDVAADGSYTLTRTRTQIIRDQRDVQNSSVIGLRFTSGLQEAAVSEAYVLKANGRKIKVSADQITVRDAPGTNGYADFGDNKILQVLYPNVAVGDRLFAKMTLKSKAIFPQHFSFFTEHLPFGYPYQETTTITAPTSLGLLAKARGAIQLKTQQAGDKVTFVVTDRLEKYKEPENGATCPCDYAGAASVSNFKTWGDVADAYQSRAADKVTVTPEIKALATELVQGKTGRAAVEAIDAWVRQNIRYVQVYLDAGGYVPHSAQSILTNRYGDCKDYVTLSQALLKAAGIDSEAVLVSSGTERYREIPVPSPEQFDHAILYVPSLKLYLDPTNRFAPSGAYQGSLLGKPVLHTGSRNLKRFAEGTPANNRYEQQSTLKLLPDGTIEGETWITSTGAIDSLIRNMLGGLPAESQEQVMRQLLTNLGEPGEGTLTRLPDFAPAAPKGITAKWKSPKLIAMDDVLPLRFPQGFTMLSDKGLLNVVIPEKRQFPVLIGVSEIVKNVTLTLPAGYQVTRLPKTVEGESQDIKYRVSFKQSGTVLQRESVITLKTNVLPPERYVTFRNDFTQAIKALEGVTLIEKK